MSLKGDTSNDTYINLILAKPDDRVYTEEEGEYSKVDITEQVIKAMNGFSSQGVIGIEYNIEGTIVGSKALYCRQDIIDDIIREVQWLLDASIVNEKQKNALKVLLNTRIYEVFGQKERVLKDALQAIKK